MDNILVNSGMQKDEEFSGIYIDFCISAVGTVQEFIEYCLRI